MSSDLVNEFSPKAPKATPTESRVKSTDEVKVTGSFLRYQGIAKVKYERAIEIAERIDEEVDIIIKGAQKNAELILLKHRNLLDKVGKELVKKETIEREEFEKLIKGKK